MATKEEIMTVDTVRRAGHCAGGLKRFCEENNLDLQRLCREGIPLSELEHIEDANLDRVREVIRNGV